MASDSGLLALHAIDRLLAERPEKVGHDFSEATRLLVRYRDLLIHRWRLSGAERDRRRLALVNAVLSVVLGGHFPLGSVPWQQIERVRETLANLVNE